MHTGIDQAANRGGEAQVVTLRNEHCVEAILQQSELGALRAVRVPSSRSNGNTRHQGVDNRQADAAGQHDEIGPRQMTCEISTVDRCSGKFKWGAREDLGKRTIAHDAQPV